VIDTATGKVTTTIPLSGVAETGGVDGDRAFVNIEDKDSIDVIDTNKHEVIAHWPVAPADSPTGMAVDAENHRIFVGGGPELVMIDDTTGKVVAHVPICTGRHRVRSVDEAGLRVVQRRHGHDRARGRPRQVERDADARDFARLADDRGGSGDASALPGGGVVPAARSQRAAAGGGAARGAPDAHPRFVQGDRVRAG